MPSFYSGGRRNPCPAGIMNGFRVTFPSDPTIWAHVRLMLRAVLEMYLIPGRECNLLTLGVDEAFTNIMRHAYEGRKDGAVELNVTCRDKQLSITLRDYGKKVPLEQIKSRDLSDIRPGGLGVHIIRSVFDEIQYDTSPPKGTILYLRKDLTKSIMEKQGLLGGKERK